MKCSAGSMPASVTVMATSIIGTWKVMTASDSHARQRIDGRGAPRADAELLHRLEQQQHVRNLVRAHRDEAEHLPFLPDAQHLSGDLRVHQLPEQNGVALLPG